MSMKKLGIALGLAVVMLSGVSYIYLFTRYSPNLVS
jgi:hypothetical protein